MMTLYASFVGKTCLKDLQRWQASSAFEFSVAHGRDLTLMHLVKHVLGALRSQASLSAKTGCDLPRTQIRSGRFSLAVWQWHSSQPVATYICCQQLFTIFIWWPLRGQTLEGD